MTLTLDYLRKKLGWCPERPAMYVQAPIHSGTSEPPGIAGPDGTGSPRNPGPFRVPGDMLRMLIDPAGTIRRSTNAPMSGMLLWFGALAVTNALIFGAVTYFALKMTDFEQTVGPASWISVNMILGAIGLFVGITGVIVAFVHGISRVLRRKSTLPMAVRVVLFGATPLFLFSWTIWAGPPVIHALLRIEIHDAAILAFFANILFFIWAIILIGIGFRELPGMTGVSSPEVVD